MTYHAADQPLEDISADHDDGGEESLEREMNEMEVVNSQQGSNDRPRHTFRIEGDTFVPNVPAAQFITHLIFSHYEHGWPNWSKIPDEVQQIIYGEFRRKSIIAGEWSEERIWKVFKARASYAIRNRLNKIHKSMKQPEWINDTAWDELLAYWNSDEFQRGSRTNRVNRRAGNPEAVPTHTGGARSITQYRVDMTQANNGVEPSPTDVVLRTHTRRTDEEGPPSYINDKARDVYEQYEEELRRQSQSSGTDGVSPAVDEIRTWANTAPRNKAGYIFGVGSDQRRYRHNNLLRGSGSSSSGSALQNELETLREENKTLKDNMSRVEEKLSRHDQMWAWFMQTNPDAFRNMMPPGGSPGGAGGSGAGGEAGGGSGEDRDDDDGAGQ